MSFKQTVLQEGMNVFKRHGIRELTMEAILSQLDISRGTLAEIARSKTELLEQCIEQNLAERKVQFTAIMAQSSNVPQTILRLLRVHLETLTGNHPSFFVDLKNFHQPCWSQVEEFSEKTLKVYLSDLIRKGIEQEQVRPELSGPLLSQLLLAQAHAIADSGVLTKGNFDFEIVFNSSLAAYMRGICTSKGLEQLDNVSDTGRFILS